MARYTIIVDRMSDWQWSAEGFEVRTAEDFLTNPRPARPRPVRVINLCRRYKYMSAGYYCSLLAAARRQWPMPTVGCVLDLSSKSLYGFALPDLERVLNRTIRRLATPPAGDFFLHVFFGRPSDGHFRRLAADTFDLFRYPLLKLPIASGKTWRIKAIQPMGLHHVTHDLRGFFEDSLRAYARAPAHRRHEKRPALYDLAILHNAAERMPPSNAAALERFVRAGPGLRIDVEPISPKDYDRLSEFDALFIRETTRMDDHTFRFSRKAEMEGIPVIDDPESILRCTNKVFMAELLASHGLPTPKTVALDRRALGGRGYENLEHTLGYPIVLKIPDGSFSQGIFKAENRLQLIDFSDQLFERSRIILAQEFMYTAYDWRVGVLNRKPLYACQYRMSRNHWQVVKHRGDGSVGEGGHRTLAVEEAPADVVAIATKAASLIGNGLYGVDLKENDRGVFVIEINDNPNIDHGVEDGVLKGELYRLILEEFVRRIERSRAG